MNDMPKQDWWSRNWKWFLPTGCLLSLVLMAGTVLALMSFVFGMMKSSDAYQQALTRAREHPAVDVGTVPGFAHEADAVGRIGNDRIDAALGQRAHDIDAIALKNPDRHAATSRPCITSR